MMGQVANKPKSTLKVSFDFVKTPITQIADYIIISANKAGTSDIHFDPREDGMMIRFRIDGDLQDYSFVPKAYERNLTTRLKLLANMNITESRLPQDGAIKGVFGDTYMDMRVSSLPLNEGEKIVIRILDYTRSLQGIDSLGFHPRNLVKLKRMMEAPNGIILVTGATGSGKSTTTYSILQCLNKPETNIITVEDPIEMNIQGINQVQVNSEIGMTFAAALRSILRQDPNVILIGEIRDSETAQIAVRAAITGHLVLSTIHTNNGLSTIERLMDMDVEKYLLSTALVGIISQRLAKAICPKCRFQRKTTPYEKKVFRNFMNLEVNTIWDANPDGCENCRRGYKGRIAIQEVLELDDEIRAALTIDGVTKEELKKMVYTDKTITLLQDALIKCLNGETNFEEVYRVIEMENEEGEDYKSELTAAIREARAANSLDPVQTHGVPGETTINTSNVTIRVEGLNTQTAQMSTGQVSAQPAQQVQQATAQPQTTEQSAAPVDANGQPQLPNVVNNLQQAITDAVQQAGYDPNALQGAEQTQETEQPQTTETVEESIVTPEREEPEIISSEPVPPEELEQTRGPIGSDAVDENGPLLEELPRLGTEVEILEEEETETTDNSEEQNTEEVNTAQEEVQPEQEQPTTEVTDTQEVVQQEEQIQNTEQVVPTEPTQVTETVQSDSTALPVINEGATNTEINDTITDNVIEVPKFEIE